MSTDHPPKPPFIWSEPDQIADGVFAYATNEKDRVLAVLSELGERGIEELSGVLSNLEGRFVGMFIVFVYPACSTRSIDLDRLRKLQDQLTQDKHRDIEFRVKPLDGINVLPLNSCLAISEEQFEALLLVGSSSNLGTGQSRKLDFNLVSFAKKELSRQYLEWFKEIWDESARLNERTIPIPEYSPIESQSDMEYDSRWVNYSNDCAREFHSQKYRQPQEKRHQSSEHSAEFPSAVSEDSGRDFDSNATKVNQSSPEDRFKMPETDELSDRVCELIESGKQVMIAHSTAIPPLDSPISPSLFSQERERSYKSITRHQAFRISILSPDQLKRINDYRKASQTIIGKLGLSLEKSVYWMPDKVIPHFENEIKVREERAKELIRNIVGEDLDEFMAKNRSTVEKDFKSAYRKINKTKDVPDHLVIELMNQIRSRIKAAMNSPIVTRVTYSTVRYELESNSKFEAPWAQIEKLILGLVKFPRMNIVKFNSLSFDSIGPEEILEAMDVASDNILEVWRTDRNQGVRRAKEELNIVKWIEDANIEGRQRCDACFRLMRGDRLIDILKFVEDECKDQ